MPLNNYMGNETQLILDATKPKPQASCKGNAMKSTMTNLNH